MEFSHISVLLEETINALNIKPDGIYVDGTAGGGGHSFHIASRLKEGKLKPFSKRKGKIEYKVSDLQELHRREQDYF